MLTTIPIMNPVFKVADTEAGLTTGTAYECQLTSAQLVGTPASNTVPATGCAAASTIPSASSWALVLNWLQDWTAADGGLSMYAYEHETELVWFSLSLDGTPGTAIATGQAYVAAGQFGGVFGGPPAPANATWPCPVKPTITVPAGP
jgi:hypothetical protein